MESKVADTCSHASGVDRFLQTALTLPQISRGPYPRESSNTEDPVINDPLNNALLHLDEQEVQVIATFIANENLTWDECAWLLSAITLALRPALVLPKGRFWWGRLPTAVSIRPSGPTRDPSMEEIRHHARVIGQKTTPLKDLQWFLAQRLFIAHALLK